MHAFVWKTAAKKLRSASYLRSRQERRSGTAVEDEEGGL